MLGTQKRTCLGVRLPPCPRGHWTPSTMSPPRGSFLATNAVKDQPCGCPHLSLLAPQSRPPALPPLVGSPGKEKSLSQEPGKGTTPTQPHLLRELNGTLRSRLRSVGGQGPGGGWDPPRRDPGGSRRCLYCCRLAPPSVLFAVSAAVSYFESQKPPLGAGVQTAVPSSFTQRFFPSSGTSRLWS